MVLRRTHRCDQRKDRQSDGSARTPGACLVASRNARQKIEFVFTVQLDNGLIFKTAHMKKCRIASLPVSACSSEFVTIFFAVEPFHCVERRQDEPTVAAQLSQQKTELAHPNCPLRYRKYHLVETIRSSIEVPCTGAGGLCSGGPES